jgi:hypothetical protein
LVLQNLVRTNIGNTGTLWDLDRNHMATWWEQGKKNAKKIPLSPPSRLLTTPHRSKKRKKKKVKCSWVNAQPSHWLHEIFLFFQNCLSPFFSPRLIPLLLQTWCTYFGASNFLGWNLELVLGG